METEAGQITCVLEENTFWAAGTCAGVAIMVEQTEDIAIFERARPKLVQGRASGNEIMRMILAMQISDKGIKLLCFGIHFHKRLRFQEKSQAAISVSRLSF